MYESCVEVLLMFVVRLSYINSILLLKQIALSIYGFRVWCALFCHTSNLIVFISPLSK